MFEIIIAPFQFNFMLYAIIIAILVAMPMAMLSCFLVLKGWSLMGDSISHAVFPGIIIAHMANIPLSIGAFIAGILSAIATGFIQENGRIKQDTAMGIVFSGMFGIGLVLYVKIRLAVHLDHILFGNMLGVSLQDMVKTGLIALITMTVLTLKWKDFFFHSFDPAQAYIAGLPIKRMHYGLLCLISLTIVGALQAVGIVFSIALLIAPGATALLLCRQFSCMLFFSLIISAFFSFLGVYLSYFIDSAPAPIIVLLFAGFFFIFFIFDLLRKKNSV